ncbi:MAG: glycosyltransferase family 39 protein [Acidobacteriota bacterium]|nr:glycosyltransferase family 39 protein [Acidobacteriota bacterium]
MSRPVLAVAALSLLAWVYGAGLDRSPVYLVHDEVVYAINANAIASTLRDINGQFLPLSIHVSGGFFATPVNIYLTALFLKVLPLTEVTVRLPSVVVGLLNIGLLFLIARRVFASLWLAVLAAGVLAFTPAHFIHSRMGTDHEYAVTAVLAWALCVIGHDVLSTRRLLVAGAILGAGVYTYLGAVITMPACVAITWVLLWWRGTRTWRPFAAVAGGFAIVLVPFVAWHLLHPLQYLGQMKMYSLGQAPSTEPVVLADRVAAYWNYFNPSFLFFAGDTSLINGTRYTGVFLLPVLFLFSAGLVRLFRTAGSPATLLIALCLLASPLAAAVVGEAYRINRALMLLPFVALVAAMGIDVLWTAGSRGGRVTVVLLLALMPLQFAGFYRDYFGDYRVRSAKWLEYNIGGGLEEIIRRQPAVSVPVYIADNVQWASYYWQFYLAKHGRLDLHRHTAFVDVSSLDVNSIPSGGLLFCRVADEGALLAAGMTRVAAIPEPAGVPWFSVLRR